MKLQTYFFSLCMLATFVLQSCSDNDDNSADTWSCGDTITDINGNVYNTVSIEGQCWTVQNLNTSNYNDDTPITNITDQTEWSTLTSGAWAYYNNDATLGTTHGKLYNWFAVETGNLCPTGWHIPSIAEWNALVNSLGGSATAASAMKATFGWDNSPNNATNSSGLSVLPSGNRDVFGGYIGLGENVWFYSSTENAADASTSHWLKVTSGTNTDSGTTSKNDGLPCRCVLD